MTTVPPDPSIYHITHLNNLAPIISSGWLLSDSRIAQLGGPASMIGMSAIKTRRMTQIGVPIHPGTFVGDYVPFYFCPRSIMLYVIFCANSAELTYRGGQGPIVHLEARLQDVIAWAEHQARRWAFSLSNAGAFYVQLRGTVPDLNQIDWNAVAARDFRPAWVKEGKQAEFLLHEFFPWTLVRRIGVHSMQVHQQVTQVLASASHRPPVEIRADWYY